VTFAPTANVDQTFTSVELPVKKSHKGLKIGLLIGGILLFLGGVAAGLMVWWTSPQKSFSDASKNPFSVVEGTHAINGTISVIQKNGPEMLIEYSVKADNKKTYADISFKTNSGAVTVNLTGAVATDATGNVYFKINNVKKTLQGFGGQFSTMYEEAFGDVIDKIDGKWVQITPDDVKAMAGSGSSGVDMVCVSDVTSKLTANSDYMKELTELTKNNTYLSYGKSLGSETVNGKSSNHIAVNIDQAKLKSYSQGMTNTKIAADLKKCGMKFDSNSSNTQPMSNDANVELWIDQWSHKVTKLLIAQTENGTTTTITVAFDSANQTVAIPEAQTQFKDLQNALSGLQDQAFGSSSSIVF
jgi:outer membrane receptor protein involved in Fe transport